MFSPCWCHVLSLLLQKGEQITQLFLLSHTRLCHSPLKALGTSAGIWWMHPLCLSGLIFHQTFQTHSLKAPCERFASLKGEWNFQRGGCLSCLLLAAASAVKGLKWSPKVLFKPPAWCCCCSLGWNSPLDVCRSFAFHLSYSPRAGIFSKLFHTFF